jgi:hypothetical protein
MSARGQAMWSMIESMKWDIIDGTTFVDVWSADDIRTVAEMIDEDNPPKITEEQIEKVVTRMEVTYDSNFGTHWEGVMSDIETVLSEGE